MADPEERPGSTGLVVVLLLAAALAIRLEHITDPPLDFHPMRQYRSAILARGIYFAVADGIPDWRREIAILNARRIGPLEPPILEVLSVAAYGAMGGEHLWVARLLSSLFWCLGGLFVYLCAWRLFSCDAALASTAYYLFLPFGIAASRTAQPDPLMLLLLTVTLWLLVRYDAAPSRARLAQVAIGIGLATLVKPVAIFVIFGAFMALAMHRQGLRRSLADRGLWLFVGGAALAPLAYYAATAVLIRDDLAHQALRFNPYVMLQPSFWWTWVGMLHKTVGLVGLLAALAATASLARGRGRVLLIGAWTGYVVYVFVFPYPVSRQDYYQLPLIPIVALGLGALADAAIHRLGRRRMSIAFAAGAALVALAGWQYREGAAARRRPIDAEAVARRTRSVGDAVGHSRDTIFLTSDHGRLLMYYGELSGTRWPSRSDLRKERVVGKPMLSAAERFRKITRDRSPEYFIVTSLPELEAQPELRAFLEQGFERTVTTDDHVVFNLRRPRQ